MIEDEQENCFASGEFEKMVVEALELQLEFLNLWNQLISSYLAMVIKANTG